MCVDVEKPFVYRMSEEPIKQEFLDGTIETENSFVSRWALHEIFGGHKWSTIGHLNCTLLKCHGVLFTERREYNSVLKRKENGYDFFC